MDLLQTEKQKIKNNQTNRNKKIVLILLFISIILFIILLIAIYIIPRTSTESSDKVRLYINNQEIKELNQILLEFENGDIYVSLSEISKLTNYNYFNGEYMVYTEDKTKCYLQNDNQVVGFEADSDKIYKYDLTTKIGYQYYTLVNNVVLYNEKLYVEVQDFGHACNLVVALNGKKISISTTEYLTQYYQTNITTLGDYTAVSNEYNNQKAMCYNMIVVEANNNLGVINQAKQTIIGTKYETMKFEEATQSFIVSINNRYGIISKEGKAKVDLKYDEIRTINYSPVLYEVKQNGLYGVIDEKGNIMVDISYKKIGFDGDSSKNLDALILVEGIDNGDDGIVVMSSQTRKIWNCKYRKWTSNLRV